MLFDEEEENQADHTNEDNLLEIQKTLCASEKTNISGVVSLKIKTCSIDTGLLSAQEQYSSIYVVIQHRNWQERTTIVRDHHGKSRFDQVKHFPVNVSKVIEKRRVLMLVNPKPL